MNKKSQTITFNGIGDQPYTAGNVTFFASTDSGLQLDYASLDTNVCQIPSEHVGQANFVKPAYARSWPRRAVIELPGGNQRRKGLQHPQGHRQNHIPAPALQPCTRGRTSR